MDSSESPPPIGHVFFSGLNEPCSLDSIVEVVVNTQGGGLAPAAGQVQVYATSPIGLKRRCEVIRREDSFTASFTPDRIGKWLIGILYNGEHINGSPFTCHVFDSSMVHVYGLDVGLVGQELKFTVDASRAGKGEVKTSVSVNGTQISSTIREEPTGSGIHRVRFTPQGPGKYKISTVFNNQPVKGSPFLLDIADSNAVHVYGDQLQMAAVDRLATFFVHAAGVDSRDLACIISGPSGKKKHARLIPLDETTFKAEWKPVETGEHRIDVLVLERPVPESPFSCQIGDPDLVTVRRMPQKIEALHKSHQFEIDATAAGSGNLEIVINGGRVACQVQETTPRHFLAQFVPDQAVKHTVEMRFNGFSVHDSPWLIPFIDASVGPSGTRMLEGRKREEELMRYDDDKEDIITELIGAGLTRAVVGQPASFEIRSNSRLRASNVSVRIMDMEHGRPVELQLSEHGPGIVRCQYTLPRVSDYEILVYINGRRVDTEDLIVFGFDPKRVRVHLKGSAEDFRPGKPAQFIVDAAEAGKGQLEISVNQGQVPNNVQMQDAGRCLVTFIPQHAGSYAIDVTFNGLQVHGCPIKVDVRERQVGKPVSAPVYARPATSGYGATVAGTSPPPTRGPSSAYHSSASPHVDTTTFSASSYAPSPSSPTAHPRSPVMVAAVHSPSEQRRQMGDLRSPALVARQVPTGKGLLGYTVAQYGSKEKIVSTTTTTTSGLDSSSRTPLPQPSVTPLSPRHKYFGEHEEQKPVVSAMTSHQAPTPGLDSTPADSAQFEMTRSAELTLFRERPPSSADTGRRQIPIHHIYDRVPDEHLQRLPTSSPLPASHTHKANDLPYAPLDQRARKTVEWIRSKFESSEGEGPTATVVDVQHRDSSKSAASGTMSPVSPPQGQIQTHIVEPYSSDIETAMTPGTRRRLLEHSVYKATDLKESAGRSYTEDTEAERRSGAATTDHEESEAPSSKHSSKATTPRLSLKFRGNKDKVAALEAISPGGGTGFDWSKSKISSKHEVVRRNKEVDVRIDGLKLAKEDQLKVVVVPPSLSRHQPADQPAQQPPELPHKLKKIGNKSWEVSFRPSEVGTHKVLIFVNNLPHPQTPFPIRVYDAGQIVVGEIVRESVLNDTVEFTVDAGRAGFGNLEMAIKDHEGIIIPSHVSQLEVGAAKFLVTFTPSSPGTHTVHITFNKEVIKGSPFEVLIVEPPSADGSPMPGKKGKKEKKNKEKQSLNGAGSPHSKSSSKEFSAPPPPGRSLVSKMPSLSRVGKPVELLVTLPRPEDLVQAQVHDLDREQLPVQIVPQQQQSEGGGSTVVRVLFSPKRVGDHEVDIRVGGIEVEGSPFTCRVYDPAKILVGGIPSGNVDKPVSFIVDASQAGVGNLEVAVNEGKIPSMAHALGQHKYEITFVPKEPIDHQISVRFNNEPVPGSPFICPLAISQQHHQPMHFSASGPGLERIPVGQMTEFFIDAHLPTSEGPSLTMESLPRVQITDPRGEPLPVDVAAYEDEPTRTVVKYTPRSVGNHQISIKCNGHPIGGSPFTAKAFDASCVKLALDGEGGQVSRACTFTIDAAKAGAGNMEIIVSVGKRNVPNYVQAEGQARFRVSFTPQEPQEHQISVKFNGVSVPGSPMRCPVLPAPPRSPRPSRSESQVDKGEREAAGGHLAVSPTSYNHPHPDIPQVVEPMTKTDEEELRLVGDMTSAQIGHPKRFSIDAPPGTGRVDCNVVVIDPQGSPLPVRCYKQQDDSYWVEFTPEVCGAHNIEVTFADVPVHGSPFHCEVIDPKRVQVHGIDRPFSLRTLANFVVDRKAAGNGPLSAELVDPHGDVLKMDRVKNSRNEDSFTFLPIKLGQHRLSLKLAGFSVPGSPFLLLVEEQRAPAVYGSALDYAIERGQQASMIFDANKQPGGLKVEVRSPTGERVRHSTNRRPDECTEIVFHPQDVGHYEVTVDFNNRPVHGSPYSVAVVDPAKVVVKDSNFRPDGMLQLHVNQRNLIDVDATAAGPAKLRAEVRDAEGELLAGEQQAHVHSLGYGKFQLALTPRRAGKYKIYLYCSELVVPSAYPLLAVAEPPSTNGGPPISQTTVDGLEDRMAEQHIAEHRKETATTDLSKVILRGEGLSVARVREPAEFIVDASEVRRGTPLGKCTASLHGEKADVPVKMSALRNQVFKGVYTPLMGGTYQLTIQIDGQPIPGSPRNVQVLSHSHPADLIEVDGRSLKVGIIGEDLRTIIDARRADPGQISAQCSGPSGPEYCELLDNRDGTYVLRVQPKELGPHTLIIKYENEHVRGSPFSFNVSHPPDPTKVKVYGPGIEHGILHSFKSNFVVETKGAGAGQLTVRVRGPRGAFNVEMQRDREHERTIHCKYEPREPGDYQVDVKWHGQNVPGSPFFVLIVDTEQELQRFFAGGVPSPTPPSPFMPPGWLPPGPPGIMPGPPAPSIMPPPHFVKGSGRATTPGSSVSGIPMPIQIQHHHPPHHYGHGPPARAPPYHPQQQPVYGRQHH